MLKHTNSTRKQLAVIVVRLVNSIDEFLLRQTEEVLGRVPEVGYNVGLLVIYTYLLFLTIPRVNVVCVCA